MIVKGLHLRITVNSRLSSALTNMVTATLSRLCTPLYRYWFGGVMADQRTPHRGLEQCSRLSLFSTPVNDGTETTREGTSESQAVLHQTDNQRSPHHGLVSSKPFSTIQKLKQLVKEQKNLRHCLSRPSYRPMRFYWKLFVKLENSVLKNWYLLWDTLKRTRYQH